MTSSQYPLCNFGDYNIARELLSKCGGDWGKFCETIAEPYVDAAVSTAKITFKKVGFRNGSVVGITVGVAVGLAGAWFIYQHKQKQQDEKSAESLGNADEQTTVLSETAQNTEAEVTE